MDLKKITAEIPDLAIGTYISVEEAMKKYPLGITVNGVKFVETPNGSYYAFMFDEAEGVHMPAQSGDLGKLVKGWLAQGTLEEINEWFEKNKFHIVFDKITTKNKRPYVKILTYSVPQYDTIIDENGKVIDLDTGEVINDKTVY